MNQSLGLTEQLRDLDSKHRDLDARAMAAQLCERKHRNQIRRYRVYGALLVLLIIGSVSIRFGALRNQPVVNRAFQENVSGVSKESRIQVQIDSLQLHRERLKVLDRSPAVSRTLATSRMTIEASEQELNLPNMELLLSGNYNDSNH